MRPAQPGCGGAPLVALPSQRSPCSDSLAALPLQRSPCSAPAVLPLQREAPIGTFFSPKTYQTVPSAAPGRPNREFTLAGLREYPGRGDLQPGQTPGRGLRPDIISGSGRLASANSRSGRILHINVARSGRQPPTPGDRWPSDAQTRRFQGHSGCQSPDVGAQTRRFQAFPRVSENRQPVYQALCVAERHKDFNLPDVGAQFWRYPLVEAG